MRQSENGGGIRIDIGTLLAYKTFKTNDFTLLLPRVDDFKALRYWLHDSEGIDGKYILGARHVYLPYNSPTDHIMHMRCKGAIFKFRNEVDAVHFKLRWGGDLA